MLFISNDSTLRCGVRVFGDLWAEALARAGVEVDRWDGSYSAIQARPHKQYLPVTSDYDLVHLNWDPQAINHYLPDHFEGGPPLSLFLHDIRPNSTCPVEGVAKLVLSHEPVMGGPCPGYHVIDHAVPSWAGCPHHDGCRDVDSWKTPKIGVSGIRDDPGHKLVAELCERRGWQLNAPAWREGSGSGPFLTTEGEIHRLSHSDVNVCWYETSGRGKSMAAMFCVAAGRPLVLSGSSMFSALWPYSSDFYIARWTHHGFAGTSTVIPYDYKTGLEMQVEAALRERKLPTRAKLELSWDRLALKIKSLWEEAAR